MVVTVVTPPPSLPFSWRRLGPTVAARPPTKTTVVRRVMAMVVPSVDKNIGLAVPVAPIFLTTSERLGPPTSPGLP